MTNGYSALDQSTSPSTTVSGVATNSPISQEYRVTGGGSQYHVVKINVSAITVVGSVTAKLQTAIGSDWVDAKTATLTTTGPAYIKINNSASGDQTYCPLLNRARVVITTTNAGDTVTVSSVQELQPR